MQAKYDSGTYLPEGEPTKHQKQVKHVPEVPWAGLTYWEEEKKEALAKLEPGRTMSWFTRRVAVTQTVAELFMNSGSWKSMDVALVN